MSNLPGVGIEFVNSGLGAATISADNTCGLITNGVIVTGKLALNTPYPLSSLDDAAALGINALYDSANSVKVYRHVRDFYSQAPRGTKLWILVLAQTVTLAQMADVANPYISNLLQASAGSISLIGLARNPASGYTVTLSNRMDADSYTALAKAQENALAQADLFRFVRVIVEGRSQQDDSALATDLRALSLDRVGTINTNSDGGAWAAVGLALGRAASLPVQRNLGYRLDGPLLGVENQFLSSGTKDYARPEQLGDWHDKGYIQVAPVVGLSGFYFTDDLMCCVNTEDANTLSRGRAIDKATRIVVAEYNPVVNSEVPVTKDGKIDPITLAGLTGKLDRALRTQMIVKGELSEASVYIDPDQDIIGTDELVVQLELLPVGQAKKITVKIGFVRSLTQ
jgi:hypothetical protein